MVFGIEFNRRGEHVERKEVGHLGHHRLARHIECADLQRCVTRRLTDRKMRKRG
jgi:hypothetical protein